MSALQAGLPNITGVTAPDFAIQNNTGNTGALSVRNNGLFNNIIGGNAATRGEVVLDASLSSKIYGNSNTVQPPALQLIPQIKY